MENKIMRYECILYVWVFVVMSFLSQPICCGTPQVDCPYRDAGILRLFYSLDDVKKVFKSPEFAHIQACQTILDVFQHDCCPFEKQYIKNHWKSSKYPFIVFEGNHRVSTSILSKRFAKTMMASHYSMSPPCLIPYRKFFTSKDLLLRRAFFSLAVYVLGYQAAETIHRWPVVVTSYWNHQAIFAMTKMMNESSLPESGSPVYSLWPEDLLKPDLLFYVNFPDNVHNHPATTRQPDSWKPRLLEFYRKLQQPITIEVSTKNGWNEALTEIQGHVIKHLGFKKTVQFRNLTFRTRKKAFMFNNYTLPVN